MTGDNSDDEPLPGDFNIEVACEGRGNVIVVYHPDERIVQMFQTPGNGGVDVETFEVPLASAALLRNAIDIILAKVGYHG
jgi:hypothetical protein